MIEEAVHMEIWHWIGLIALPVIIFGVRWWWSVESAQDKKIDALKLCNHKDHQAIRKELGDTKDQMNDQHNALRDKLDDIWKHLVRDKTH